MPQWPFFLDVKDFSQPNTLNIWITAEKKEDNTPRAWSNNCAFQPKICIRL